MNLRVFLVTAFVAVTSACTGGGGEEPGSPDGDRVEAGPETPDVPEAPDGIGEVDTPADSPAETPADAGEVPGEVLPDAAVEAEVPADVATEAEVPADVATEAEAPRDAAAETEVPSDVATEAGSDALMDGVADEGADPGSEVVPPPDTCLGPVSAALANARVPDGYCPWTWASGLSGPRGLEVAGNGDLLVVEAGLGRVTALFDDNSDGVSGTGERVALASAAGLNHGIAISGGFLYASSSSTVYRWPFAAGDRRDLGAPQTVVRGIPAGGHSTRTLAFDGQGRLYVSIGSNGNVDVSANRSLIRRFVVQDLPAGGLEASTGEVFASGLRNEVGLAFDALGQLWGVENGRDNLSRTDLGGDIHQTNPAEEVNLFAEPGRFYGYPYCFTEFLLPQGVGGGPGTQWVDPDFMNDGIHTDAWCRDTQKVVPPILALTAHNAPLGMVFYDGAAFPDDVRGDAFVALHGSWNASPATGYRVVRLFFEGGARPQRFEPFLSFAGPGETGAGWPHRPVDVRVGPAGILWVSSDASGVVIAVGHR